MFVSAVFSVSGRTSGPNTVIHCPQLSAFVTVLQLAYCAEFLQCVLDCQFYYHC